MNKDLLKKLYGIYSPSRDEGKMRKFLKKYSKSCGAKVQKDTAGNLLVTKGESDTYPCIAAHIDQVQKKFAKDFTCIEGEDAIMAISIKLRSQLGLGADDKNGIFVALECLEKYDVLKVAFFVGEEVGCVGSNAVDISFFDDCRFILQADRRNGNDLITEISGELCSKDFLDAIGYENFGYKTTTGMSTDVGALKRRGVKVSCVNMSCGYYDPHTDHEYTVISELENCLNFVQHIIENCTDVYPHEYTPYYQSSSRGSRYYDDAWWESMYNYRRAGLTTVEKEVKKELDRIESTKVIPENPLDEDEEIESDDTAQLDKDEQDFNSLCDIIFENPKITLEKIWEENKVLFFSDNIEHLKPIYEDALDWVLDSFPGLEVETENTCDTVLKSA